MKPDTSGHLTFMANHISMLDKKEPYPTIILKSDNKYVYNLIIAHRHSFNFLKMTFISSFILIINII